MERSSLPGERPAVNALDDLLVRIRLSELPRDFGQAS